MGAAAWGVLALAPLDPRFGIGLIEKLFLQAPLVIVPLGLALAGVRGSIERAAGLAQPWAAAAAVASFFLPAGERAGLLALPWLAVTALAGVAGILRFAHGAWRRTGEACFASALTMLPVGGFGFVLSRLHLDPLGYGEPLGLLTGVHFHFAAFVAPLFAGA
ncbi:MAG: hypothetical protein DMG07_02540, partial [Acidobacteria bacterium]